MTIDEYYDQLCKSKVEVAQLKAALTTIAAMHRRQRSKKNTEEDDVIDNTIPPDVNSIATALVEQAKKAAQIYVLCWCYFTSDSLMGHRKPRVRWDDVDVCFATEKSKKEGYIAELFKCVPLRYHDYLILKRKPFPQLVCSSRVSIQGCS
jgi:hypothetical protein